MHSSIHLIHLSIHLLNQNFAARIVTRTRKHDHVTPVVKELIWLPVATQFYFRNAVMAFKCLTSRVPEYHSSQFIKREEIVRQLVSQWVSRKVSESFWSVRQSISQSVSHEISQPVNQTLIQFFLFISLFRNLIVCLLIDWLIDLRHYVNVLKPCKRLVPLIENIISFSYICKKFRVLLSCTYLTKFCGAAVYSWGRSFSHVTTRTQVALKFVGRGLERSFMTSAVAMVNVVFEPWMVSEYTW